MGVEAHCAEGIVVIHGVEAAGQVEEEAEDEAGDGTTSNGHLHGEEPEGNLPALERERKVEVEPREDASKSRGRTPVSGDVGDADPVLPGLAGLALLIPSVAAQAEQQRDETPDMAVARPPLHWQGGQPVDDTERAGELPVGERKLEIAAQQAAALLAIGIEVSKGQSEFAAQPRALGLDGILHVVGPVQESAAAAGGDEGRAAIDGVVARVVVRVA